MTRQERTFSDRAARPALVGVALAAALAGCALVGTPAAAADDPPKVHLVPGVVVAPTGGGDDHPRPGGRPPGAPDDDDDRRPVAPRATAGVPGPGAADALAVRALRVPAVVSAAAARRDGVAASFVPRPGSLVAEVRLVSLRGGARRPVARQLIGVRAGRRAAVRLRVAGLRAGRYEVVVRAGAGVRTLGPPVAAGVRVA